MPRIPEKIELKEVRPAVWIFVYIVATLVFAGVYSIWLDDEFYHSTVQHEPSLQKDSSEIVAIIQSNVTASLYATLQTQEFKSQMNGWDLTDVFVGRLDVNTDTISLPIFVFAKKTVDNTSYLQFIAFVASYNMRDADDFALSLHLSPDAQYQYHTLTFEPHVVLMRAGAEQTALDYGVLFPRPPGISTPLLKISLDTETKLIRHWRAKNGRPSEASGNWWRMLYLSAITITTTGYGDIVPITPKARFAVGLEAVFGIVMIGLFLNSLFHERTRPRQFKE